MSDEVYMVETKDGFKDGLKEVLFGSISGAAGKVVEFPFDTVKVRLQYSQALPTPLFSSAVDCIRKTYQKEGFINGFYRGIASPILGASLEMSCLFLSYNMAQEQLRKHKMIDIKNLSIWDKTVCGGISGIVTSFILTPIELVKCQMQVQNLQVSKQLGISQVIRKLFKNYGFTGLWRGQTSTLIREAGGSALWFGSYEYTLQILSRGRDSSATDQLVAGAVAGVMYNFSFYPVDTVKSIIQTQEVAGSRTMVETFGWVWRTRGVRGLYQGLGVALLKAVPANAVVFFTYETMKRELAWL